MQHKGCMRTCTYTHMHIHAHTGTDTGRHAHKSTSTLFIENHTLNTHTHTLSTQHPPACSTMKESGALLDESEELRKAKAAIAKLEHEKADLAVGCGG